MSFIIFIYLLIRYMSAFSKIRSFSKILIATCSPVRTWTPSLTLPKFPLPKVLTKLYPSSSSSCRSFCWSKLYASYLSDITYLDIRILLLWQQKFRIERYNKEKNHESKIKSVYSSDKYNRIINFLFNFRIALLLQFV